MHAAVDSRFSYLRRSFCVLEVLAAVHGNCRLVVRSRFYEAATEVPLAPAGPTDTSSREAVFGRGPVDVLRPNGLSSLLGCWCVFVCQAQVAFALQGLFSRDGTAQKHRMKGRSHVLLENSTCSQRI